jgi:hypothetical protein
MAAPPRIRYSGVKRSHRADGNVIMDCSHPQLTLAEELQREAERIYNQILHSDTDWIDIEIRINELRERCRERAPDKVELFDAVYGNRFVRLWEQWRLQGDTSWTWRDDAEPEAIL